MPLLLLESDYCKMEKYRSGHNEAVLKTVCPKGRVGSNPTFSAKSSQAVHCLRRLIYYIYMIFSVVLLIACVFQMELIIRASI